MKGMVNEMIDPQEEEMNYYEVKVYKTSTFKVRVEAFSENEAIDKAIEEAENFNDFYAEDIDFDGEAELCDREADRDFSED